MRLAVVLAGLALAAPVSAKPPMAWPSGTYGNVHTHEETGDMLGMEARFFEDAGEDRVEFVQCEGWCNDVYVLPVTRGNNAFLFHRGDIHFAAWLVAGRLKIGAWEGREPLDEGRPQVLRRLAKPFAIPFARVNGAR